MPVSVAPVIAEGGVDMARLGIGGGTLARAAAIGGTGGGTLERMTAGGGTLERMTVGGGIGGRLAAWPAAAGGGGSDEIEPSAAGTGRRPEAVSRLLMPDGCKVASTGLFIGSSSECPGARSNTDCSPNHAQLEPSVS
jgi:hypothetical protein